MRANIVRLGVLVSYSWVHTRTQLTHAHSSHTHTSSRGAAGGGRRPAEQQAGVHRVHQACAACAVLCWAQVPCVPCIPPPPQVLQPLGPFATPEALAAYPPMPAGEQVGEGCAGGVLVATILPTLTLLLLPPSPTRSPHSPAPSPHTPTLLAPSLPPCVPQVRRELEAIKLCAPSQAEGGGQGKGAGAGAGAPTPPVIGVQAYV